MNQDLVHAKCSARFTSLLDAVIRRFRENLAVPGLSLHVWAKQGARPSKPSLAGDCIVAVLSGTPITMLSTAAFSLVLALEREQISRAARLSLSLSLSFLPGNPGLGPV